MEGRPHPLTQDVAPVTLGHEFCGRVSKASVKSEFKVGQAVMVDPWLYCHSCSRCKASNARVCYTWGFLGISGRGGGLAEKIAIPAAMCYPLPEMRLICRNADQTFSCCYSGGEEFWTQRLQ